MVRWGVLGSGWVVQHSFLPALEQVKSGQLVMVGSRQGSAGGLAQSLGVPGGSYQDVVENPGVDVVYLALPNHLHEMWALNALRAGKHVLAEKPLGLDVAAVDCMIEAARAEGRFLWEAFAFPFREQMTQVERLLADGVIGAVRHLQSVFYSSIEDPANIRWDRAMGGGALYDVGCYPVHLAGSLFGESESAHALTVMTRGVDVEVNGQVAYQEGRSLQFLAGLNRPYETWGQVLGTAGRLLMTNPYHPTPADRIMVRTPAGEREYPAAQGDVSFQRMVWHVNAAILGAEAPRHVASHSALRTARTLERLRADTTVIGHI